MKSIPQGRRAVSTLALIALALILHSIPAPAADRVWDGGGANDNWSTPANWDGDLAAPAPNDSLTFDGSLRLTPNNDLVADSIFGPLTFAPGAGSFVIGGNRITLGGNLTSSSALDQTLNLPLLLNDNRTITTDAGALNLGGVISGSNFGITKSGAGNLILRAANTYTGPTIIDGGTLTYAVDNAAGNVRFGADPTAASASANLSTLDLTNANLTATALSVQTNSATANAINIGAGKTLTVTGPFTVGVGSVFSEANAAANTALNVAGNSLVVNGGTNHFTVGVGRSNASTTPGADPIASMDMSAGSGLNNFSYTATTGELRVGGGNVRATLTLGNGTNTITAAAVRIADSNVSGTGNNNGGRSIVHLGGGANVINTNNLIIGETKSVGTLDFASTPAPGTLTLAGQAGGTSTVNIVVASGSNGTAASEEGRLLLAGHNATVQANNVVIGRLAASTGGNTQGLVTFDTGTFNVNSLQLGVNSSGTAANGATGTFILGGASAGSGATGVLNVANQFFLANRTNSAAGAGPSKGRFIINGGTANVNTDILDASTTAASSANDTVLTLDGGTLNMTGHNIGTYAAPITTINLNSGNLNNIARIAGKNINIQSVNITGTPTWVLGDGGMMQSGPLTLASGGGLEGGGNSPALIIGDVTAAGGSRVAPGSATTAGSLQFLTNLSLEDGSTARFKISENPTFGNDQVSVTGNLTLAGTVNLDIGALGAGPQTGNTYTLFNYSGTLTGNETNFKTTGLKTRSTFSVVPTATTPGSIQLTVGGTGPIPLTWIGNVNNTWDVDGAPNWRDGSNNPQKFFTLDPVTFDDTSTNTNPVQLVGQLAPGSVTVNANRNYTFTGSGSIIGGTGLTKSGNGTLVIVTDNTYSGNNDINGGSLQVGDGGTTGSVGSGAINLAGGNLVFKRTNALAVPNVINGGGNVIQDGAGTTTLGGANTFSGGLTVNGGALRATSAAAAGSGPITVNNNATFVTGAGLTNPITLAGGTIGTTSGPNTFTGDLTLPAGTNSTYRMADPQNLPTTPIDVNEIIITGTLQGAGNLTVLSNGQDNSPDGGNGFRLRGTGNSAYSGTITVGNNVKFELQSATAGAFSPAGTGKIVMTAGDASLNNQLTTVTTTGGYSEINLRNNTNPSADITFGNDVAITGTGMVIFNPLGSAAAGTRITMGNLSVGTGQEVAVYLGAAPDHVLEFKTVTLNGTATFSPKKPGFGATTSIGSDLLLGDIGQTVPSGVTMGGLRTLTLSGTNNTYTGATSVNSGKLVVTGSIANSSGVTVNSTGTFEVPVSQKVQALTVNTGGTTVITTGATKVLTVGNNTSATPLAVTGKLDLNANGLVVDHSPGSDAANLANVRGQIVSGYNNGDWLGNGITSTAAAANPSGTGIGYALSNDVLSATGGDFLGQSADGSAVLARYTLLGDASLDGAVDFNDLVRLAQNYNTTGGVNWAQGDFTYDGNVDFNDLVKLAQNYNTTLPPAAASAIPGAPANFDQELARAFSQVPEPAALALIALVLFPCTRRRRA
jgi:autotransporter-associated beta strand protein